MAVQYLLLRDVEDLGRSGDVVSVKPGHARNWLLPQRLARIADPSTLHLRDKLRKERAARAERDRIESLAQAEEMSALTLVTEVKVDQEGHLYGSVGAAEIATLLEQRGLIVERRNLVQFRPLKRLGQHTIQVKLKEGVTASIEVQVNASNPPPEPKAVEGTPPSESNEG